MGRKSAGRRVQQRRPTKTNSRMESRVNRRGESSGYGNYVYEETSHHYEYGERTKPQRYPQPVREVYLNSKLTAKNISQEFYLDALRERGVVVGSGSAGSGKTFLAVGVALEKLVARDIDKIYITRPIVEAGESLGFLPGSFEQKVLPYMMPMLDSIEQIVGKVMAEKLVENGTIEFVPLAYMRGRTFGGSRGVAVIVDEAQNMTVTQMKLALTRIGENCSMFITGDPTQSDLKEQGFKDETGLEYAVRKLRGRSSNISVIEFSIKDAVRSDLMQEILMLIDAPDQFSPTSRKLLQERSEERPRQRPSLMGG